MTARAAPAGSATREALLLTAERLFAERGLDAVSLRQINAAAGQRNASATHYHFGSRQALVQAICDYRMERVDQRRRAWLAELGAGEPRLDPRGIVEAVIWPIAEEIRDSEGGEHYIRFFAQLVGHPQISLADIWSSRFGEGLGEVMRLLRRALPGVPADLLGQRFGLMWEQAIHALADRERLLGAAGASSAASAGVFVSNLIDMVAAGLAAPVSAATRRAQGHRDDGDSGPGR